MPSYLLLLHLGGAIVLIGTGTGIAFFMLCAHLTGDPAFVARTASTVVLADYVFTLPAVLLQPVTGYLLAVRTGWPVTEGWVAISLLLYVVMLAAWLPVVRIQKTMRDLAWNAVRAAEPLPPDYRRAFRLWTLLGIPGLASTLAILVLMVWKPAT